MGKSGVMMMLTQELTWMCSRIAMMALGALVACRGEVFAFQKKSDSMDLGTPQERLTEQMRITRDAINLSLRQLLESPEASDLHHADFRIKLEVFQTKANEALDAYESYMREKYVPRIAELVAMHHDIMTSPTYSVSQKADLQEAFLNKTLSQVIEHMDREERFPLLYRVYAVAVDWPLRISLKKKGGICEWRRVRMKAGYSMNRVDFRVDHASGETKSRQNCLDEVIVSDMNQEIIVANFRGNHPVRECVDLMGDSYLSSDCLRLHLNNSFKPHETWVFAVELNKGMKESLMEGCESISCLVLSLNLARVWTRQIEDTLNTSLSIPLTGREDYQLNRFLDMGWAVEFLRNYNLSIPKDFPYDVDEAELLRRQEERRLKELRLKKGRVARVAKLKERRKKVLLSIVEDWTSGVMSLERLSPSGETKRRIQKFLRDIPRHGKISELPWYGNFDSEKFGTFRRYEYLYSAYLDWRLEEYSSHFAWDDSWIGLMTSCPTREEMEMLRNALTRALPEIIDRDSRRIRRSRFPEVLVADLEKRCARNFQEFEE